MSSSASFATAPPPVVAGLAAADGHWPIGATIGTAATPRQVVRGVVLLRRQVEGRRPVVLEILGPGAVLGMAAAEAGTTAHAATPLCLRPLEADEAMAGLLRRIQVLQDRAVVTSHGTAEQRLAWLLVRIAGPGRGGEIALPLGLAEMASYLGLTPETLSRGLATLRRRGLLGRVERGMMEVLLPEALRGLYQTPVRRRRQPPVPRPLAVPEGLARHGLAGRA